MAEDNPPKGKSDLADSKKLAAGSSATFAGQLVDRSARFGNTWMLSRLLGTGQFGLYTSAVTIVTIAATLAAAGLDNGVVYFGSQASGAEHRKRFSAILFHAIWLSALCGIMVFSALLLALYTSPQLFTGQTLATAIIVASPIVLLRPQQRLLISALHAQQRMKIAAVLNGVFLPVSMLIVGVLAVLFGAGLVGALVAASVGFLFAIVGSIWALRHDLPSLLHLPEKGRKPAEILRYSLPLSIGNVLFRLNIWTDILMLTWLTTSESVGIYKVAAALAMLTTVPTAAVRTALRPMVAKLIASNEISRLSSLLTTSSKWLIVSASPIIALLLIGPNHFLSIFGPKAILGATALVTLVCGQCFNIATSPIATVLTMGGHPKLDMKNGMFAALVNITLNAILIPQYGISGAAIASATALATWALLRTIEVRLLIGVNPFSTRLFALLVPFGIAIFIAKQWTLEQTGWVQLGTGLSISALFCYAAWKLIKDDVDQALFNGLIHRIRGLIRTRRV
jgi:O-antigen/teichoic acid export membrane protein